MVKGNLYIVSSSYLARGQKMAQNDGKLEEIVGLFRNESKKEKFTTPAKLKMGKQL